MAAPVTLVMLAVTGCSSGSNYNGSNSTGQARTQVPVSPDATGRRLILHAHSEADLGTIITGPNGDTVYAFSGDTSGKPHCYGDCESQWPPVTTVGAPGAAEGALPSKVGYVERQGGSLQVTYNGHPLYYYAGDERVEGKTKGAGVTQFHGRWSVLSPNGGAGRS
ncbi:MAG: COG4315 family predicted lipoprotein [Sciscionella sp.]